MLFGFVMCSLLFTEIAELRLQVNAAMVRKAVDRLFPPAEGRVKDSLVEEAKHVGNFLHILSPPSIINSFAFFSPMVGQRRRLHSLFGQVQTRQLQNQTDSSGALQCLHRIGKPSLQIKVLFESALRPHTQRTGESDREGTHLS
jgi:hypothetical protein